MESLNKTAHKLLDVAEKKTQLLGFNGFSYKDLQNEVGIKTSSIHYYFPSKQDLACAMINRYTNRFDGYLQSISQSQPKGLKRLSQLADLFIGVVEEGKFCLCGMLASDFMSLEKSVVKKLRNYFDRVEKWIYEAIEIGKKQNEIKKEVNSVQSASCFFALLEGGMLMARTQQNTKPFKEAIKEFYHQIKS